MNERVPCPHCGAMVFETDEVCMDCGERLLLRQPSAGQDATGEVPAGKPVRRRPNANRAGPGAPGRTCRSAPASSEGKFARPRKVSAADQRLGNACMTVLAWGFLALIALPLWGGYEECHGLLQVLCGIGLFVVLVAAVYVFALMMANAPRGRG